MAPKRKASTAEDGPRRSSRPKSSKPTEVEKAKEAPKQQAASPYKPKKAKQQVDPVTNAKDGSKRDSRDRLVFDDFPNFKPTLTPKQVIQAGSFGGIYFNPTGGRKSVKYPKGVKISADEFPKDWFEGLDDKDYKGTRYDVKRNKYGVKSGQNQQQWEEQGWIRDQDPRGWFQWYCRFFLGRRTEDDKRQISRWTGVAGEKGRWKTRLVNQVAQKNAAFNDQTISPVIRQNLLHWAYELTERDFNAMIKKNAK
jgi:hypothetical protein